MLGFAAYCLIGTLLLCLPFSHREKVPLIDHAFNVVSAVSTTGLTTRSVGDTYTPFGQGVLLALFQLGGIGFMTLSSLLILASGKALSGQRVGVLKAGFSVPHYFVMQHFVVHVVTFTFVAELLGSLLLWWRFSALGVADPLWSAVFHSVSAFATAGFSLYNNSLEGFAHDWVVQVVIGVLCYLGAIGFIVVQDVWYSLRLKERLITFTSKVILVMTASVFVLGSIGVFLFDTSIAAQPLVPRLGSAMFQTMTASSTAGFNTIPIGAMSTPALVIVMVAMLVGASPSGTGGGIKTTSVSAILGNLASVLRGRPRVEWLGRELPLVRVLYAFAATSQYLIGLLVGTVLLCALENKPFLALVFEASSALGTVGLSMGITGDLTLWGKLIIIALMFAGRCGPLTLGLALLRPDEASRAPAQDDLAV